MMLKASLSGLVLCLALASAAPWGRGKAMGMGKNKGGDDEDRSTRAPGVTKEPKVRFCPEGQKPDCGDSEVVRAKDADPSCEDGSAVACIDFTRSTKAPGDKGGKGRGGKGKGKGKDADAAGEADTAEEEGAVADRERRGRNGMGKGKGKGSDDEDRSTRAPGVTKEPKVRFCPEGQKPACGDSEVVRAKDVDPSCEDGSAVACIDFTRPTKVLGDKGGKGKGKGKDADAADEADTAEEEEGAVADRERRGRNGMGKGKGKGGDDEDRSTRAPGVTKEPKVRFCPEGQKPDCGDSEVVRAKDADPSCEDGSAVACIDFTRPTKAPGDKGGKGRKGGMGRWQKKSGGK